ncbi:hypothetical protein Nepgr_005267 [Nepenthes gracilis]|uniref:Fanconi Anaemia group E protein C-terminal domain-containing protein n=1 Tax=Nepenthes gracilis TaxID=150966 RepID=A0AAD3S2Y6_NEPGR|nr:hypothetical protein Nepgr_005267 [Nepenthes gracilis]
MEAWVPLFNIFLNSSTPEAEASFWLQQSFNASSSATFTTNSFIALLTKLSDAILIDSSSPLSSSSSDSKRVMLIETLPNLVQTRILSFLAHEHSKFCSRDLFGLVRNVLNGSQPIDFWVRKAAYNLLAKLSQSNPELGYNLNVNSVSKLVGNEFYEMPSWLKDAEDIFFLPWLPLSLDELKLATFSSASAENVRLFIEVDEDEEIEKPEEIGEGNNNVSLLHSLLDPEFRAIAASLKEQVLDFHSTSKTVELADKIRQLCLEIWRDSFAILALIEPWKADDETLAILLSRILGDSGEEELGWPSQVLCSTILPKLLVLEEPASRVLVSATMEYCKLHQKAAEYALLFPLILRKDGINNPICDVVTRIIKECFHTAHIASFCQKLLCVEDITKRLMCLPCHQPLLSDKVIWTEPLFSLFQNILNHNVHLTQDSIDHLVYKVRELAERFSMSLKFGNFLLCFVTKCSASLSSHERRLTEAVNLTNTLVTKSVLAKLASL